MGTLIVLGVGGIGVGLMLIVVFLGFINEKEITAKEFKELQRERDEWRDNYHQLEESVTNALRKK